MGDRTLPAPQLSPVDGHPVEVSPVDLTDHDAFVRDVPHDWFTWLRRHDPVSFTPEPNGPGFWSVTRHADIVEVSRDWRTYSSQTGATALEDLEPDALRARRSMLDADPPLHTTLRRTVNHPFTRRAVDSYQEQVRQVVVEVLDEALERDEFDFVEQVAVRVPIRVLCRILGVPVGDEPLIVELSDKLIANTDPELTDVLFGSADSDDYRLLPFRNPAALDIHAYGRALARTKLADPDASLVSHLVNGRDGREPLQGRDFDAMFLLLAVAGNETTRSGLSLGLDALIDHPDQWNRLRGGPSEALLHTAAEELLRYTTPLHHFRRTATRDTELGGRRIATGDKVVVWYPSGNRDETVFAEPHRLDLARTPNPHLAFGRGGPHRCLGEHLALLEIRIVLQELLTRVTGFERTGPARRVRSNFVNGLKALPVAVTGRP